MIVRLLHFVTIVTLAWSEGPYTPFDNSAHYPINSLNNPGALFPLGGDIPSTRVHHTITASSNYLFVYGGYAADGSYLGDINLFYIPSQQWSGPLERKQCCNRRGEEIETIGADISMDFGSNGSFPDVSVGFEGDAPLPRAEHASCVIAEQMYMFGGVTEQYSYVHDLYSFDPVTVRWHVLDSSDGESFPRRRAGHSMVCDSPNRVFYVFGGRATFGSTMVAGLNDVWRYDVDKQAWTLLTRTANQATAPGQRQHASMVMLNGNLYIYGGINPANGLVYNDVWIFRIAVQQWERLYSHRAGQTHINTAQYPSGDSTYQFAPPPLFLAHIVPIPESLDPYTGINTTFYGSDTDTSRVQNGGFLIYGGVGGGGNCGARSCRALETTLGQVYKFSLLEGRWTSPHTITGYVDKNVPVNDPAQELQYIQTTAWQYARLSSSPTVTDGALFLPEDSVRAEHSHTVPYQGSIGADSWTDRGKWLKTFAYEKVVFHPQRNVLYEFGGMIARKHRQNDSSVSHAQSTTISTAEVLARDAVSRSTGDSDHVPTGTSPILLDAASGNLNQPLWDRNTGEDLRQVVDIPVNEFWDYTDGINAQALPKDQIKPVEFLRVFRTYTVSPSDIVLIKEDTFPL